MIATFASGVDRYWSRRILFSGRTATHPRRTHVFLRRRQFAILVFLAATVHIGSSPASAQTGLVAAWGFNEGSGTTVADASGNNNAGTVSGATWTTAGRYGSALVFDGTSANVTVANSASLRLTAGVPLEGWGDPVAGAGGWRGGGR